MEVHGKTRPETRVSVVGALIKINAYIDETPIPWHRQKGDSRYNLPQYEAWKSRVNMEILEAFLEQTNIGSYPIDGTYLMRVTVFYETREEMEKAPDCSNMLKGIEDALTGLVWVDDSPKYLFQSGLGVTSEDSDFPPGTYIEIVGTISGQPATRIIVPDGIDVLN